MPRRTRQDFPGAWWHVVNRGVAKRALFETRRDYRYFLSLVARAVRRGQIEVHAYCLLNTHFHLLLRSPDGDISAAMQRIQDMYARWFNRQRKRDGPLFRGRFGAKRIHDVAYRRAVFLYVHANPVAADIVAEASSYPFSSAWYYARGTRPPWLSVAFGERVRHETHRPTPCPELVARWIQDPRTHIRAVEKLVRSTPPHIARWLQSRARLADGTLGARTILLDRTLVSFLATRRRRAGDWSIRIGRRHHCAWTLLEAGLLRMACGRTLQGIASRLQCTVSMIHGRLRRHRTALIDDAEYARVASEVVRAALQLDYGSSAHPERLCR